MAKLPLLIFTSPILFAFLKLLDLSPFNQMEWYWITSPWWFTFLAYYVGVLIALAFKNLEQASKEMDVNGTSNPTKDSEDGSNNNKLH